VIEGEGGTFCSGGDRREGLAIDGSERRGLEAIQNISRTLLDPAVVSFAAVEGWAVGGGAELALACDVVIAATSTRFRFTEVELGVHATGGATWLLPRAVGRTRAAQLMLAAEPVDGTTAAAWGLATEVVPDGGTRARAMELAERVASFPADSLMAVKRSLLAAMHGSLEQAFAREVEETEPRLHGEHWTM
jgi:enoyl-CoA hydratase/carnithine racemase